jgi:rhomboid protease GluP
MPGRRNYGLPLLIDINVLVYLLMVLSGLGVMAFDTDDLIPWGALYGPAMEGFGALRLISCQFVHGGLMHILSNMYGLLFAGLFLGPIVRNARLIVCYLVCGTAGAVTSLTVHPEIVSVGASGAIMGLCGILLVLDLLRDKRLLATRRAILINVGLMVSLTLSYGAESAGVDNAAHLGGLAAGIVVGLTLYFLPPQREDDPTGDVPVA